MQKESMKVSEEHIVKNSSEREASAQERKKGVIRITKIHYNKCHILVKIQSNVDS